MRAKQWIGVCAIVAIVAGHSSLVAAQTTSDVWQVQMVLNGIRKLDNPPPYSKKLTVTGNNLVNLALGNAPGTPVPANQVLAWVNPQHANPHRLVVFDTTSGSVLAEIGGFDVGGSKVQTSRTQYQAAELLTVEPVGSETNGLVDGSLMCVGTRAETPDGQQDKLNLTVSGWLVMTVTDSGAPLQTTVLVSKGTFVTTKQLGTLIEPSPVIGLGTNALSFTATAGGPNPPPQSFTVCNYGPAGSVLNYTIDTSSTGVVVSPSRGILGSGQCRSHVVTVNLNGTPAGAYTGTLTISDPNAANSPQTIAGTLTVNPQD